MHLNPGTLLKGGTYRIERFINSGGYGCTYEAVHTSLDDKFAIKEFFVKDFCNREEDTFRVTVGTHSKKALVDKLKGKFIEEAKSIRKLHHNGIVRVSDVFEENGTAYYVMDYIEGRSLKEIVEAKGKLSETEALRYIRQVSDTLKYVHSKNMLHLDIKPGNIMIDEYDNAILIDFGASKQYDEESGENTSTLLGKTPGYAPPEQMSNMVMKFTPATDIYALGATMYKMLTGITPPESNLRSSGEVELEALPPYVDKVISDAIYKSLSLNKQIRPQSIAEFLKALDEKAEEVKEKPEDEGTDIDIFVEPDPEPDPKPKPKPKSWIIYAILAVVLGVVGYFVYAGIDNKNYQTMLSDKQSYITLIGEGDSLLSCKKYSESINRYEQAQIYEKKYTGTEYSKEFDKRASSKIEAANEAEQAYKAEQARLEKARLEKEQKEREAAEKARLEKERKEREAAETARLEKERKEREAAEKARLEKERQQPGTAEYNRTHGSKSGHDWVDLGLPSGIKWATSNVGASRPEEYGDYFAWGETREKSIYDFDNSVAFGKNISDIKGDSRYDAARANWGGSWRLPTKAELEELEENCTWSWTTQGGKQGCKVTGPNGNSIFLPAAGFRCGTSLGLAGERGDYWSSTPNASDANSACCLRFNSSIQHVGSSDHYYYGRSVRPVSE